MPRYSDCYGRKGTTRYESSFYTKRVLCLINSWIGNFSSQKWTNKFFVWKPSIHVITCIFWLLSSNWTQIYIDENLNWNTYLAVLKSKLSRAVGMLNKLRFLVDKYTLRMVCCVIFSSILSYGAQIWGQHNFISKKIQVLQNKALRVMDFEPPRISTSSLLKLSDIWNSMI